MTNKTEMVSVPRELLERLISATKVARGHGSPTQRDAEAILAAPTEDVRAVVGEPVGYRVRFYKEPEHWMVTWKALPDKPNPNCEYQLLYNHVQHDMVMPDYKKVPHKGQRLCTPNCGREQGQAEGWNACLDEFKRLNQ